MSDLAPTSVVEFPVTLPGAARLLELRLGAGELISTEGGSACLVNGAPLAQGGTATFVSALPDTQSAALYTSSTAIQAGSYGVRVPLARLQSGNADPTVLRLPLAAPSTLHERWSYGVPPELRALTVRISGADLLRAVPLEALSTLVLTATLLNGALWTQSFQVRVDGAAPTGTVTHSLASGFGYLAYRDLSADAAFLTLIFPAGDQLNVPVTSAGNGLGVLLVEDPRSPASVTATDHAGNTSGNLLARTSVAGRGAGTTGTPFSPWPLPAYLNPRRPVLGGLITAAERALDVGPERAGDALSLDRAAGSDLNRLSRYYGLPRMPGEGDAALAARVKARFLGHKASRAGLALQLTQAGAPTARVADVNSQYLSSRTLDGSWTLDGNVRLGGEAVVDQVGPGQVKVTFSAAPAGGWEAARQAVSRHTAAGVVPALGLDVRVQVSVGQPPRTEVSVTHLLNGPSPLSRITDQYYANPLTLDGSWILNGAQTPDGSKG